MNELIKNAVIEGCGGEFDPFERAFASEPKTHEFSPKNKRRMEKILAGNGKPRNYRAARFAARAAAAAAGVIIAGGLTLGGVKLVDSFTNYANENAGTERFDYLVNEGKYYPDGDKSAGFYFEVSGGAITLKGDRERVFERFLNDREIIDAHKDDPEFAVSYAENMTNNYMSEIKFALVKTKESYRTDENGEKIPVDVLKYGFAENVDERVTDDWQNYLFLFDDRSLLFDGVKTIRLKPLGDFVLIK